MAAQDVPSGLVMPLGVVAERRDKRVQIVRNFVGDLYLTTSSLASVRASDMWPPPSVVRRAHARPSPCTDPSEAGVQIVDKPKREP